VRLETLKTRPEFQRVRGGGRADKPAFLLEGKQRPVATATSAAPETIDLVSLEPRPAQHSGPRFGFTITKKIGGAVQRNRMRRRLKAALTELAPAETNPDFDYVVVARPAALTQDFAGLKADLAAALKRVNTMATSPARRRAPQENRGPDGGTKPHTSSDGKPRVAKSADTKSRGGKNRPT